MSKHTDSPDVSIYFDRTKKEWVFEFMCVGLCNHALCETMPPQNDDICTFNRSGCLCAEAQNTRLRAVKRVIDAKIKEGEV